MTGNDIFRISVFGGYNKADVKEYIQTLEQEIDLLKKTHQEEKKKWMTMAEEGKIEQPERSDHLQDEIERLKSQLQEERNLREQLEKDQQGQAIKFAVPEDSYAQEKSEEREYSSDSFFWGAASAKDEMFTYDTVKKIIEDAQKNAELIKKDAELEADKIIKDARADAEKQKELIIERINAQLDEKGIQLMAAKYKIEQYLKEVSSASQALYSVYEHMSEMVQSMPLRIDNYWEEDYRKLMEKNRREVDSEENAGKKERQEIPLGK